VTRLLETARRVADFVRFDGRRLRGDHGFSEASHTARQGAGQVARRVAAALSSLGHGCDSFGWLIWAELHDPSSVKVGASGLERRRS
jgi:hypothetical protein